MPNGAPVAVELVPPGGRERSAATEAPSSAQETAEAKEKPIDGYALNRKMLKFAGTFRAYPKDFSVKLDHYLYDVPKNP
jgi:hypothetical protein